MPGLNWDPSDNHARWIPVQPAPREDAQRKSWLGWSMAKMFTIFNFIIIMKSHGRVTVPRDTGLLLIQ